MKNYIFLFLLLTGITTASYSQAPQIQLRIPDTTGVAGNAIIIPVYVDNTLTGQNVYSYQIQLYFNASLLKVISVIDAGTVSESFGTPFFNATPSGVLTIAGAGSTPLSGSGIFLYIQCQLLQTGSAYLQFTNAANNMLNEGSPLLTLVSGNIYINPSPVITISPGSYLLTVGDSLQFSAYGGTTPYQWSVTNTAAAIVNASGLLHATAQGFTKVIVKDFKGLIDTTNGQIEIRALRLTIPDTAALQGQMINIPVYTTALNNLNITSGSLSLSYDPNIIEAVEVITTNTLLSSDPPFVNINNSGQVKIAFAGTTPLTGRGVLLYVRYIVSPHNTGSTTLNLSNAIFNENIPATIVNGYFSIQPLPPIYITPNTASILVDDSLQFSASNGTTPYSWSTSNTNLASIESSGMLIPKKGGVATVMVADALGASATTENIQIYDTYISIPDTTVCSGADTVALFLKIGKLPAGQSVSSIQGTISYTTPELQPIDVVSTGTLTNGWSFVSNIKNSQFIFAGASSNGINSQGGVLLKIRFVISNLAMGGTAWVNISNILLNEGSSLPEIFNGSITKNNFDGAATITANGSTTFCAGGSVTLTAPSGMTAYKWSDGETTQAITVIATSSDFVTLTNSTGCSATSQPTTVTVNNASTSTATVIACDSYLWNGTNYTSSTSVTDHFTNAAGCDSTASLNLSITGPCTATLSLKMFIQGYYQSLGSATPMDNFGGGGCLYVSGVSLDITEVDTVTISLMDPNTQSQVGASVQGILHTDGSVWESGSSGVIFPGSAVGNSYFIKITHRNAIETWSASPVLFASNTSYDFSTSRSQAYGSNMVKVDRIGGQDVYAFWNGDVYDSNNGIPYAQDGVIESADYGLIEEDYTTILFGYYTTDVTGDGVVESLDYSLIEENYTLIIFKATPW